MFLESNLSEMHWDQKPCEIDHFLAEDQGAWQEIEDPI